ACNCTCPATGPGPTPGGSCSPPSTPHPTAADLPLSTARQGPTGTEHVEKLGRPADHPCPRAADNSTVLPKRPRDRPRYTIGGSRLSASTDNHSPHWFDRPDWSSSDLPSTAALVVPRNLTRVTEADSYTRPPRTNLTSASLLRGTSVSQDPRGF